MDQTDKEKEKKQITLFKSIPVSKEGNPKFFIINNNNFKINLNNNNLNINSIDKDANNQLFKTHKEKNIINLNNTNSTWTNCTPKRNSKGSNNSSNHNNRGGIFITTHEDCPELEKNVIIIHKKNINNKNIEGIALNKNCGYKNTSKEKIKIINNHIYYEKKRKREKEKENKKNAYYNNIINNNNLINRKLNLVYFESIKSLSNNLNHSFFQLFNNSEQIININEFLLQLYQKLQILNLKIETIKKQEDFKPPKEEMESLIKLKNYLINMNKILNNNLSQNILKVYLNVNKFCSDN